METETDYEYELMTILEGKRTLAYEDTKGLKTVGIGFNMDSDSARTIWDIILAIPEDFDAVYNKEEELSEKSMNELFHYMFDKGKNVVKQKCNTLNVDYDALPKWHQFILNDIKYNTGSVRHWFKVFTETEPKKVLYEARRHPYKMMDTRVCKIAHYFNFADTVEDCKTIGLKYAKYTA